MRKSAAILASALAIVTNAGSVIADQSTSFLARQVELRHIDYDVTVGQWDGKNVRIKVVGELPDTPAIQSRLDNGRLVVKSTDNYSQGGNVVVIAEGAGSTSTVSIGTGSHAVVVQGNGIHISAANSAPRPRIEISLPASVGLNLQDFSGEANIKKLHGHLNFKGPGSLRARKLGDSSIDAWGNAELQVDRIDGAVNARLAGNAELQVDSGRVTAIEIRGRDNAEANLDVSADSASLEASGNAEIQVHKVREKPQVAVDGNAEINVGNWPDPDA